MVTNHTTSLRDNLSLYKALLNAQTTDIYALETGPDKNISTMVDDCEVYTTLENTEHHVMRKKAGLSAAE